MFEPEISAGHCADRTQINHIQRIAIGQRPARENVDPRVVGAVDNAKFPGFGDQPGKSNATGAEHATFLIVDHAAAEIHCFGFQHGFDGHSALLTVVFHVIILQLALAGLITDGAVDRMVDQFQLHNVALDFFDLVRIQLHLHAFSCPCFACRDQRRSAIFDTHQAHAAIAVCPKRRMVAKMGNLNADSTNSVDQIFA